MSWVLPCAAFESRAKAWSLVANPGALGTGKGNPYSAVEDGCTLTKITQDIEATLTFISKALGKIATDSDATRP